jgi:hypothetical protein
MILMIRITVMNGCDETNDRNLKYERLPRKERLSTLLSPDILDFIDQKMQSNDETTSTDLVKMLLEELNVTLSETTAKRVRRKWGWLSTGTKYCQLVREANQGKRLQYCEKLLRTGETFDDVIFTDKSSIAMESPARLGASTTKRSPKTSL